MIGVTILVSAAALQTPQTGPYFVGSLLGYNPWWHDWMIHRHDLRLVQLFTHQFIHGGVLHLAGNMLFLFTFGNAVNAKLGNVFYVPAYLGLGFIAGLAWLGLGDGEAALGASGAIFGVIGLYLIYFPRNKVRGVYVFVIGIAFRAGTFETASFWLILAYVAFDILGTLLGGDGVAHFAHLGGAAAGMVCGITLLLTGRVMSSDTEQNLLQVLKLARRAT